MPEGDVDDDSFHVFIFVVNSSTVISAGTESGVVLYLSLSIMTLVIESSVAWVYVPFSIAVDWTVDVSKLT